MQYPRYPDPKIDNVKPSNYNGKQPVSRLIELAKEFQALGLYPVPKKAGDKIAHWKFWMKKNEHIPLEPTEENLNTWLPRSDIDGLILAVGKSLNGRLAVLDLDPAGDHLAAETTYNEIQRLSPTGFVITTPSNGLHLYYRLPEGVEPLKPTTRVHWQNLDIRAKNSLIGLPGSFQQYTEKADKKGVHYGHVGYYRRLVDVEGANYSQIPTMSMELYTLLWKAQNPDRPQGSTAQAGSYEASAAALARIEAHLARPIEEQEKLTLELLEWVLKDWENETYDKWLQMWMAAYHASSGSHVIRDYIASSDKLWHGRPQSEVRNFISAWDSHDPKPDGYTVASLMFMARAAGWLATTGMEIPSGLVEHIDVRYISDWTRTLQTIPSRVLLQSQTGSGKTYNIRYLYDALGKPKTVIFVPSIKLAMELAATLRNEQSLPATLYIDPQSGRTKEAEVLKNADILVTTLQTFAMKVWKTGTGMAEYGLVYFEESDQLFQQFAKGGGRSIYASHVSDEEARVGFAVIRDAFLNAGNVWCVDATMTQVTYQIADATRGKNELRVVKNTQVSSKSEVQFLRTKGEAYQVLLRALLANRSVVVVADTAQVAKEAVETMEKLGALKDKKYVLITSHTERSREVHKFMADVNGLAPSYDLVAYNSVMASGVSITSTTPDVIVQFSHYLTPRVNLQLLNRYRKQSEVYCYYAEGENLYTADAKTLLSEAYRRAGIEAMLINIPLAERTVDASLRSRIAAMSVGDEYMQRRSAKEFYSSLLEGDGRTVRPADPFPVSGAIAHAAKRVRELQQEERDYLRNSWPETRPINRENPADPEMTDIQVAQGEIHARILKLLGGNVPDEDPAEIYDTVFAFAPTSAALTSFLSQGKALRQAEVYLADEGRAITTLVNNVTLIKVLANLHHLFKDVTDTITTSDVVPKADAFMAAMVGSQSEYDAVINRQNQKFKEVYDRSDNNSDRSIDFAKILLARIGLRLRVERGSRSGGKTEWIAKISNAESALKYVSWLSKSLGTEGSTYPQIPFGSAGINQSIQQRQRHMEIFRGMSPQQQAQVMKVLNDEKTTDFQTAVETVLDGMSAF